MTLWFDDCKFQSNGFHDSFYPHLALNSPWPIRQLEDFLSNLLCSLERLCFLGNGLYPRIRSPLTTCESIFNTAHKTAGVMITATMKHSSHFIYLNLLEHTGASLFFSGRSCENCYLDKTMFLFSFDKLFLWAHSEVLKRPETNQQSKSQMCTVWHLLYASNNIVSSSYF